MINKTWCLSLLGLEAQFVQIEVAAQPGLPGLNIIGLTSKSIAEAKDRILAVLKHLNFKLKARKITVNLSPAHLQKNGTHFDLAIIMAILANEKIISAKAIAGWLFFGELGLDGSIKSSPGLLPMILASMQNPQFQVVAPMESYHSSISNANNQVKYVNHLSEVITGLTKKTWPIPASIDAPMTAAAHSPVKLVEEVVGQTAAKQALLIALAGGHHLLMVGPPGTGKTELSKTISSLLPPLSTAAALETTSIYSLREKTTQLISLPPIRSPHHTISLAGMLGGGENCLPGEISLAHHGVLFLDELPEFARNIREALREPLEEGKIKISRAKQTIHFPANFTLIAAMNPCQCGQYLSNRKHCQCSVSQRHKYWQKISGPLLDRFDLSVWVENQKNVFAQDNWEPSLTSLMMKEKLATAIKQQLLRSKTINFFTSNGHLTYQQLTTNHLFSSDVLPALNSYTNKLNISTRSGVKLLRVTRTIADLAGEKIANLNHLQQAMKFRLNQEDGNQA